MPHNTTHTEPAPTLHWRVRTSIKPLLLAPAPIAGPLHDQQFVQAMVEEADARGWRGHSFASGPGGGAAAAVKTKKHSPRPLEELLEVRERGLLQKERKEKTTPAVTAAVSESTAGMS